MPIHPGCWRQAMTEIGVPPWQHLFERLVGELDQPTSADWKVQTNTLDPKVYYDVGRFDAEQEHLFRRLPLCLGHIDQLAEPGAVLAVDLCDTPLLMARGADRVPRVFLNVCRHRGARLMAQLGEVCRRRTFVCPYHGWTYHPDYISHLGMYPDAADQTLFVHTMLIPEMPTEQKAEEHWRRSFELIDTDVFNSEDLVVCEQIQRGLRSGANEALIVGRLEQNLRRFHSSIEAAIQADPRTKVSQTPSA